VCARVGGEADLGRGGAWPALASDADRPFDYMRSMRTEKLLTVTLSSSVSVWFVSASVVVSDVIPPEGCNVGRPMYGKGGGANVDGPASAFPYSYERTRDTPYGWDHSVGIIPVLVGPVLG
jgi:hypothetical protein